MLATRYSMPATGRCSLRIAQYTLISVCAALSLLLTMATASPAAQPAPSPVAAVVQRQLEAYNAQDVEAFVACYAPDVIIIREEDGSTQTGRDGMRERYAAMFKRFPKNRATVLQRIVVGDYAVDEERIDGRDGPPFRTIAVYRVKDGLITHVRFMGREAVR